MMINKNNPAVHAQVSGTIGTYKNQDSKQQLLNQRTGKPFRWVAQGVRRPLQPFRNNVQAFR